MSEVAPQSKAKGEVSDAAVRYHLLTKGVTVLEPFGDNQRYDLVCEISGSFSSAQVKTGTIRNGRVQFDTRSSGTTTRGIEKEGYEGDIDVFAVYAPELEDVFIVPIEDAPETTMGLRFQEPDKPSSSINWASDYRVAEWSGLGSDLS